MKNWFLSLQDRERIFVSAGMATLIVAVVWFGLWLPINNDHKATKERVNTWKLSLAALKPMRVQIQASANNTLPTSGQDQSLIVIIDTTVRQRGLTESLQRSQPTASGSGIRVEFQNAAFDDLILWIGDLHRQYGLQLESGSFSMAVGAIPGYVNSNVTLEF